MKPKIRVVLQQCIDCGIALGYSKSYKHTDKPSKEVVFANIEREIWNSIDEMFTFEEDEQWNKN